MRLKIGINLLIVIVFIAASCSPVSETVDGPTLFPSPQPTLTILPNVVVITPTYSRPFLPVLPGQEFCENAQVKELLTNLSAALVSKDGLALVELIDLGSGLDLYYTSASLPVHLSPNDVAVIFESEFAYNWGDQPGSGLPVEGTFVSEILPSLLDVFNRDHSQACQTLETGVGTGPTTAMIQWPEEFNEMPYIALYRYPSLGENELDWRIWAVGFTVVQEKPRIRVMVQYFWEI